METFDYGSTPPPLPHPKTTAKERTAKDYSLKLRLGIGTEQASQLEN